MIRNLLLATGLFSVSLALGTLAPPVTSSKLTQEVGELLKPLQTAGPIFLLLVIFLNNSVKALGVIVFGAILGLPPVLFICGNGLIIGALTDSIAEVKGLGYVVAGLAPHGVIEIPMLLLATALGLTVGWESLKWITGRKSLVKSQLSHSLKLYLTWILPGLVVAAVIEVFITPWIAGLVGNG